MKNRVHHGFTLLEMLVVVAVAAMILSVVLVSLNKSKAKSRDTRREEDIKEIQNAVGLYAVGRHVYPICLKEVIDGSLDCLSQSLLSDESMSAVPTDPLGRGKGVCNDANSFAYCYESDGFDYTLEYILETDSVSGKSAGLQSIKP